MSPQFKADYKLNSYQKKCDNDKRIDKKIDGTE